MEAASGPGAGQDLPLAEDWRVPLGGYLPAPDAVVCSQEAAR